MSIIILFEQILRIFSWTILAFLIILALIIPESPKPDGVIIYVICSLLLACVSILAETSKAHREEIQELREEVERMKNPN